MGSVAFGLALIAITAMSCTAAVTLLSPTEGQKVREYVKIMLPASAVPDSGFISVLVGEQGQEKFVAALSRDSAKESGGNLIFYWNSKAPYYDPNNPSKPLYFKDGKYPMKVQVHDPKGKCQDFAIVNINLKNKVDRTNPAPGVSLINRLAFGQVENYRIHSDVAVFEMVNGIGLPLLGGLGVSADSKIIQSVEDVRNGGEYLMRYRTDDKAYVSYRGVKSYIYAGLELKPQLYRLIDKYGKVLNGNMFAKQARFQISDILPVLPKNAVKEGDSWPDNFNIKIDGLTNLVKLKGTSMLDSFEWQNGQECAKITGSFSGNSPISLVNGKVIGTGPVKADVTTYFAYKSGKMIRREIDLAFDCIILSGAGDELNQATDAGAIAGPQSMSPYGAAAPFSDEPGAPNDAPSYGPAATPPPSIAPTPYTTPGTPGTSDSVNKKGIIQVNVVESLEK